MRRTLLVAFFVWPYAYLYFLYPGQIKGRVYSVMMANDFMQYFSNVDIQICLFQSGQLFLSIGSNSKFIISSIMQSLCSLFPVRFTSINLRIAPFMEANHLIFFALYCTIICLMNSFAPPATTSPDSSKRRLIKGSLSENMLQISLQWHSHASSILMSLSEVV